MNRSWDCLGFRNGGEGDHEGGGEGGVGVVPSVFLPLMHITSVCSLVSTTSVWNLGVLVFCLICI